MGAVGGADGLEGKAADGEVKGKTGAASDDDASTGDEGSAMSLEYTERAGATVYYR